MAKACDLTDSAGVDALMAQASRLGLTFDMLLNVAGVDFEGGFLKRKREKVMRIVALNNEGTLRITHAVLQRRTPNRRFTVVLVSSLASLFPMPLKATYAASKRFLLDFGLALAPGAQGSGRKRPDAVPRRSDHQRGSLRSHLRTGNPWQLHHQRHGKGCSQNALPGPAGKAALYSRRF